MTVIDNNTYLPPANIRDFESDEENARFRDSWHQFWYGILDNMANGFHPLAQPPCKGEPNLRARCYNPLAEGAAEQFTILAERTIPWMAFPRIAMVKNHRDDRQEAFHSTEQADIYGNKKLKSEYCEWFEYRDKTGKLSKVVFTTEFPDYWEMLWAQSPERVVALYNELLDLPDGVEVSQQDLEDVRGEYDRYNAFNTRHGQIHMLQEINNIPALGLLVLYVDNLLEVEKHADNFESRNTPAYETFMSADAKVCIDLRSLMRKGLYFSLQNPIGMYILGWNDDGWRLSNGHPATPENWKVIRGNEEGQILRLEYQIPEGETLFIGGTPVTHGGQIAEHVTVGITGVAAVKNH